MLQLSDNYISNIKKEIRHRDPINISANRNNNADNPEWPKLPEYWDK